MRQVAIAFATTGPTPKRGHRISELVAVEKVDAEPVGKVLHLYFNAGDPASDKPSFAAQLDALDHFVADAPIVLHDPGVWRRFLRVELQGIKNKGARRLLTQVVDVSRWAHQRYPKHRKSVAALAKRLNIVASPDLSGLRLTAVQLALIGRAIQAADAELHPQAAQVPVTPAPLPTAQQAPVPPAPAVPQAKPAGLLGRLGALWRAWVGSERT